MHICIIIPAYFACCFVYGEKTKGNAFLKKYHISVLADYTGC